jgi:hypothetical protein
MSRHSPRGFACCLLESVLPVPHKGALLGDLIEECALRAESTSESAAACWFWAQVCRSIPFMVGSSLRVGDWLIRTTVAIGVFAAMGIFKIAADLIIEKLVAPGQTAYIVLAPIVFLTTTSIGGCAAARIRSGTTIFLALIVMAAVAVLIGVSACSIPVPWWYQLGFLTLGPLSVLFTPAVIAILKPNSEKSAK